MLKHYKEAIAYLNSFINFERLPDNRYDTRVSDLDRFRKLLHELGNPQSRYPSIHIAGTKGKGSTAVLISSILKSAGYKVGLFTSPHLITVRERIRVNGRMVSKPDFASLISRLYNTTKAARITEKVAYRTVFEHLTGSAFLYFAHRKVDVAVVETGLGGKLDATIVLNPIISILTPIGLDHTAILGETIAEIAADKAHIIKPGTDCVSARQGGEAKVEFLKRASSVSAQLIFAPGQDEFKPISSDFRSQKFITKRGWLGREELRLNLLGNFQLDNVSTVLTALQLLRRQGFRISAQPVRAGLSRVNWQGRLQYLRGKPPLIIDGSHNTLSMEVLLDSVRDLVPNRRLKVVFSAMKGKPVEEMLRMLSGYAEKLYLAPLAFPKGMSVDEMKTEADGIECQTCASIPSALELAKREAAEEDIVLATGSLYLVGEVLRHMRGLPPPPADGRIDDRV